MSKDRSVTFYVKEIFYELDREDGMVHAHFKVDNTDICIVQTRHFFFKSRAGAEMLGRELCECDKAQVAQLSARGPMFLREAG